MAKDANLYIRTNQETKDKAEKIYSTFGITISDAVNIFLNKSILVGGLPFGMLVSDNDAETEKKAETNHNAKRPVSESFGCIEILYMADDFDAPLEEMSEYM